MAGAARMEGGTGNDTYVVDNVGDTVTENPGEGVDTVQSSIAYTLGADVENLVLAGSANIAGTGNELANQLTGNAGNNRLDGKAGADAMAGGAGDDTYVVDDAGDTVTEASGEGTDSVESSIAYKLGANLENLTLTGGSNVSGTGNGFSNQITGNTGNNTLDGKAGADAMAGGAGNDTYIVDDAGDTVTEASGEGTDIVKSSVTFSLGANVENLTLTGSLAINGTGNELDNKLVGNGKANVLDGGAGADAMSGGKGNDTYVVDNTGDTVTEKSGAGTDTVEASVTYTLGANVEKLTLTGSGNIAGTGNGAANTLTGNAGNNTLDGKGDADAMAGGKGNDTYVVDNVGDTVTENAGEGTDSVKSSVSWTLGANVENLTLTGGAAIDGTGNELANTITGNASANILTGGAGDDVFVLTSILASDTITDFVSGSDKVQVSMAGIAVGDGDTFVDGAVTRNAAGGFATTAELVVMKPDIVGAIDASSAAAAIGSAKTAYAIGQTALFMVDNGSDSALYYFSAQDANAVVDASELTLLVSLTGTPQTTVSDLVFGA